jgi:hypothetical protein
MNEVTQSQIQEFIRLLFEGIESWMKAGQLLVEMIDHDPATIEKICAGFPAVSRDILYRFEQIGRKEIYPLLLVSNCPGISGLIRMPYSQQVKHEKEPIPVLIDKDGEYDTLMVDVRSLTPSQCKQVFSKGSVRDEGAQRAWLETEKKNAMLHGIPTEHLPYFIRDHKVVFSKNTEMGKRDLQQIIKML